MRRVLPSQAGLFVSVPTVHTCSRVCTTNSKQNHPCNGCGGRQRLGHPKTQPPHVVFSTQHPAPTSRWYKSSWSHSGDRLLEQGQGKGSGAA